MMHPGRWIIAGWGIALASLFVPLVLGENSQATASISNFQWISTSAVLLLSLAAGLGAFAVFRSLGFGAKGLRTQASRVQGDGTRGSRTRDSQTRESGTQGSETQDSDSQDLDSLDSETLDSRTLDSETQDSRSQDSRSQDSRSQDSGSQDPRSQDSNSQDFGSLNSGLEGSRAEKSESQSSRPQDSSWLPVSAAVLAGLALVLRFMSEGTERTLPSDPLEPLFPLLHPSLMTALGAAGILLLLRAGLMKRGADQSSDSDPAANSAPDPRPLLLLSSLLIFAWSLAPALRAGKLESPLFAAFKSLASLLFSSSDLSAPESFAVQGTLQPGLAGVGAAIGLLLLFAVGLGLFWLFLEVGKGSGWGAKLPSALPFLLLSLIPLWRVLGASAEMLGSAVSLALFELGAAAVLVGALVAQGVAAKIEQAPSSLSPKSSTYLPIEGASLLLLALCWWLLKVQGLGLSDTDENVYFYAAKLWAEGVWPYRDFFFSHPPGHLVFAAILFRLFGVSLLAAKLIPALAIFIAAFALHRLAKARMGKVAGVAAPVVLLFSAGVLKSSANYTGVNLSTLFLTLGLVAAFRRRSFISGAWFGAALSTGVYTAGAFAGVAVLSLFAPRREGCGVFGAKGEGEGGASKTRGIGESARAFGETIRHSLRRWGRYDFVRLLAGFALVVGVVTLFFVTFTGSGFIEGVYTYHLRKPSSDTAQLGLSSGPLAVLPNLLLFLKSRDFASFVAYHPFQLWLAFLSPLAAAFAFWLRAASVRSGASQYSESSQHSESSPPPGSSQQRRKRRGKRDSKAVKRDSKQIPQRDSTGAELSAALFLLKPWRWWRGAGINGGEAISDPSSPHSGGALRSSQFPSFEPQAQALALLSFWISWALFAEFAMLPERYSFYFTLIFPSLALCAAFVLQFSVDLARWVWLSAEIGQKRVVDNSNRAKGAAPFAKLHWLFPLIAFSLIFAHAGVASWANRKAFPDEFEATARSQGAGEVLNYEWNQAPYLPKLGELVHALFWSDTRTRGTQDLAIRDYLRSKKRYFSTAPEIAALIRETTLPEETITGASTSAPLIALLADRRLAGDVVDTNSKVFRTGMLSPEDFWQRACDDRLTWVIGAEMSYFSTRSMSQNYLIQRNFDLAHRVSDPWLRHWYPREFSLWRRQPDVERCAVE